MKKYKLKRDLPTFNAGDEFWLDKYGNLYSDKHDTDGHCILAYRNTTIEKFPNILKEWFEEIPERPKTVDNLKEGDVYYAIGCGSTDDACIECFTWHTDSFDIYNKVIGNIFLTKKEAKKELARRKAEVILRRDAKGFALGVNRDWFQVYYNYATKTLLAASHNGSNNYGTLAFSTRKEAEASIEAHEKEWLEYLQIEEG